MMLIYVVTFCLQMLVINEMSGGDNVVIYCFNARLKFTGRAFVIVLQGVRMMVYFLKLLPAFKGQGSLIK